MDLRESILEGFDYDLWANKLWFEPARQAGREDIMGHIVGAQEIWLTRVIHKDASNSGTLEERLMTVNSGWRELISVADLDGVIAYKSFAGLPFENPLGEIARHVLNHGTYHRGELRGRAEIAGVEFPETDFIGFLRHRVPQVP